MTAIPVEPQTEKANPADNLSEWLDQKTKAADAVTAASVLEAAAEPAPVTPAAAQETPGPSPHIVSMEDRLPSDFEHGFFRDKPVKELVHSYRATEAELKRKQEEAKRLSESEQRLRADIAARDLALQMAREQQQQREQIAQSDPYGEIEQLWFENPRAAAAKLREMAVAEARQAVTQETGKFQQANEQERQTREMMEAGKRAYDHARSQVAVPDDVWEVRSEAVLARITNPRLPYYNNGGPLNPDNYLSAWKELFGEVPVPHAPAPITVVAAPPATNPPGSTRAASAPSKPNKGLPNLTDEQRKGYAQLAESMGLDKNKFLNRFTGGARG